MRHRHDEHDHEFAQGLLRQLRASGRETAAVMLDTFITLDARGWKLETCVRHAVRAAARLEVPQCRPRR